MVTVKLVMILMKRKFVAELENISMGRMATDVVALLNLLKLPTFYRWLPVQRVPVVSA